MTMPFDATQQPRYFSSGITERGSSVLSRGATGAVLGLGAMAWVVAFIWITG